MTQSDAKTEDERAVTSEPVPTADGDEVVVVQQNVGPGNQVGGGEFKNTDHGKSPEQVQREQDDLQETAPIDEPHA
jgi:hypothetical protein